MTRRPAVVLLLMAAQLLVGGVEVAAQPEQARELLERAAEAAASLSFEGRLVIVSFDTQPSVTEVEIARDRRGALQMGREQAWMMGRRGRQAFLWDPQSGRLLRFGGVEPVGFSVERLLGNYRVEVAGVRELRTGSATVLSVHQREPERLREHLYIDHATGLIVRRDTFRDDGRPERVLAYTSIEEGRMMVEAPPAQMGEEGGQATRLGEQELRALASSGWVAPDELPGGYRLRNGYALPEPDTGSLQLVYSDGLYTLSLYEQRGELSPDGLDGAVRLRRGDLVVHRWPGSEPARLVWSGGGIVFTLITDAPDESALAVAAALPHDPPRSLAQRMLRRFARFGERLWPFD